MNVTIAVRFHVDQGAELNAKVEALRKSHADKIDILDKKIKSLSSHNPRLEAERSLLVERGKYLTASNLIRYLVLSGLPSLGNVKDEDIFKKICDNGVPLGRPKEYMKGRRPSAA